jgi:hypothetical protein
VIDRSETTDDYTQYPGTSIDPRRYGCGEPLEDGRSFVGTQPVRALMGV